MILYCYDCGQENLADRKFCKTCGSPLSRTCRACDFLNQVDAKFCGGCGIGIEVSDVVPKVEAERRQLTIMFCDLVGSSELTEQFDLEDYRDLLRKFQQLVSEVTLKFEGYVAKYIGDGLLIYFGHPHAHEDDARRSILAALGILEKINVLNSELRKTLDVELKVRIGIHTGEVVIGEMGVGDAREGNAIVGEAPNIAARIESLAEPNTIAISQYTHNLTKGFFIIEDKGTRPLKGVSQRIKIYKVLSKNTFQSDFDLRSQQGLTPIVGREKELNFLEQSWDQVKLGRGQVVWLSGEAGVGKSRVINEFITKISCNSQNTRIYYCSSVHSSTAFYPIISHLKRLINFQKNETDDVNYMTLKEFLASRDLPLGHIAPLISPLLGIIPSETIDNITPEKVKRAVIDSWVGLMVELSKENPLLIIFEDIHWVDPSTQELIDLLSRSVSSQNILLLITSRPHYHLKLQDEVSLQSLTVNRLDPVSSAQMIADIGGEAPLPEELIKELILKADGVPLFIEELTRTVINSTLLNLSKDNKYQLSRPLSTLDIPSSLKDSLMARLDQVLTEKNVVQVAAVIGRYFSVELLESLSLHSFELIKDSIDRLIAAKLIIRVHESGSIYYQFSHALLHETAYQSLLKSTRKQYHGLIADSIIKSFPHYAESEPEVLALHCDKAGKVEQAAVYLLAAGKKANKTSSHHEAIAHFDKGIELLQSLPENEERHDLEFQIQVRLLGPLIAAKSYAAAEVEEAFTRALELSKLINTSHEIFPVLHGRYAYYQVCGLVDKAESLVDEFYERARHQEVEFEDLELIGSRMRGASSFLVGNSELAEKLFKQSNDAYDYERHKNLIPLYAQDIKVTSLSYLSLNQWHLGKVNETYECANEAIELAERLSSANSIGIAYTVAKIIPFALLDDPETVLISCEKLIEIATNQKMPLWQVTGVLYKGWALVRLGKHDEGMKLLDKGLSSYFFMKIGLFRPCVMLLYAQACMCTNRVMKGINALEESLELSNSGGEHWLDAETHRSLGELMLAKPNPDREQARLEYNTALEISQKQKSMTLELRVCMSILRFASEKEEILKAKKQLKNICEKFDTFQEFKDLSEARQLLGLYDV